MNRSNKPVPASMLASTLAEATPAAAGGGSGASRKAVGSDKLFKMKFMQRTVHAEQVKQAQEDQAKLEREAKWRIARNIPQPKLIVTHSDSFLDFVPPPVASTGRHQFSASDAPPIVIGMDDDDADQVGSKAPAARADVRSSIRMSQISNTDGPMSKPEVHRPKTLSANASRLLAGLGGNAAAGRKRKGADEDEAREEVESREPPTKRSRGKK